MKCINCGEDIYEQVWLGEEGEERDWTHVWSGDVLCSPELRQLALSEDEFHALFEASEIATPERESVLVAPRQGS